MAAVAVTRWQAAWAGFRAMLPLWLGALPFALAYTVAARKSGLDGLEVQQMSLLLGSATVQLSLVNLLSAAPWLIFLTAFFLSVQLILYGLILQQKFLYSRRERLLMGAFLTDGAYALTLAGSKPGYFLLGAELSMYLAWNFGTLLGLVAQGLFAIPAGNGLDFIFPLMFLVVLVPLVRERVALITVGVAVLAAWLGGLVLPSGLNILLTALVSGLCGLLLAPREAQNV